MRHDLETAKASVGFAVDAFQALAITEDRSVVLTSADANGWRMDTVSLAMEFYFCLDPNDFEAEAEWSNGGVAIDALAGSVYTNPSLISFGGHGEMDIEMNDLETYDSGNGIRLDRLDISSIGLRSTGLDFMPDRGTLLATGDDGIFEARYRWRDLGGDAHAEPRSRRRRLGSRHWDGLGARSRQRRGRGASAAILRRAPGAPDTRTLKAKASPGGVGPGLRWLLPMALVARPQGLP